MAVFLSSETSMVGHRARYLWTNSFSLGKVNCCLVSYVDPNRICYGHELVANDSFLRHFLPPAKYGTAYGTSFLPESNNEDMNVFVVPPPSSLKLNITLYDSSSYLDESRVVHGNVWLRLTEMRSNGEKRFITPMKKVNLRIV